MIFVALLFCLLTADLWAAEPPDRVTIFNKQSWSVGRHVFGSRAIPSQWNVIRLEFDRIDWFDAGVTIEVVIELSFDGGKTFPGQGCKITSKGGGPPDRLTASDCPLVWSGVRATHGRGSFEVFGSALSTAGDLVLK